MERKPMKFGIGPFNLQVPHGSGKPVREIEDRLGTDHGGIPLEALRELMNRAEREPIDVTPAQEGGRLLSNGRVREDS
jgi:hypothetical protein